MASVTSDRYLSYFRDRVNGGVNWASGVNVLGDPSLTQVTGAITSFTYAAPTSGTLPSDLILGFNTSADIPANATFVSGALYMYGARSTGYNFPSPVNIFFTDNIDAADQDSVINASVAPNITFNSFPVGSIPSLNNPIKYPLNQASLISLNTPLNTTGFGVICYSVGLADIDRTVTYRIGGAELIVYYTVPDAVVANTIYMYKTSTFARIGSANIKK